MTSQPFSVSSSSLRERHLAALCGGVAVGLVFPKPGWAALGLLLVLLAMRHRSWVLFAFLTGLAGGAINGAMWRFHQVPGECLGEEVDLSGLIVTLPREQRLATGQRRVTAEMDVQQVDDPLCSGPKRVRVIQWRDELAASMLVLAHRGSRTSSSYALLKWATPDWALVSAGRGNAFGHPHGEVVERVTQSGRTTLLSTAISGAIEIILAETDDSKFIPARGPWASYWLKLP